MRTGTELAGAREASGSLFLDAGEASRGRKQEKGKLRVRREIVERPRADCKFFVGALGKAAYFEIFARCTWLQISFRKKVGSFRISP